MLKSILFLTLALNTLLYANDKTETAPAVDFDQNRWKALMALIDSEIKTINSNRYSGPELKHRMFELYSEKIKLIKEKENLNFLKVNITDLQKNGKEAYFASSTKQYQTAQQYALGIIKQYPKYDRISEIFYAMAINSRDYGTSKETERYLIESIKTAKKETKTLYNARTALAEYYYNNKNYNQAVNYYNYILVNTDDEWHGKHLYNAAWCHLKERNFQKALELMKKAYDTTKEKKYVSMKEQTLGAIGIFFVQADATYEGIEFFQKNTKPAVENLLSLANSSMNKNNFSITNDVLTAALNDSVANKDPNLEMKVRLTQLDIYRESKKDDHFFQTANKILTHYKANSKKSPLRPEDVDSAANKIKEVAGFMQINLVKDKSKDPVDYNPEEYKKIMRFFDILATLDRPKKQTYRYFQGETALSIRDYKTSLEYYVRAVMNSRKDKLNNEVTKKTLEAMLAVLDMTSLQKKRHDEFTIFTLKNYLSFYPKSDKSQVIYQKLFNKYYELKRINKSINLLLVYERNYAEDIKIHREMLTQVLDHYIKTKNTDKLAFWVNKIEQGYLKFDHAYVQNSIAILGSLLFNKYQALEKSGKLKEAIAGYEMIYESKLYPKKIKAEAAYAISAVNLEQNDSKKSYKWLEKSFELYDNQDLIKITKNLYQLTLGYRLLQNTKLSTQVAMKVSKTFCNEKFDNKEDFYQLINENLILDNEKTSPLIGANKELSACGYNEKLVERTQKENLIRLIAIDNTKEVVNYYNTITTNKVLDEMMDKYLSHKFYQAPMLQRESFSAFLKKIDQTQRLDHYDQVIKLAQKLDAMSFSFSAPEKFDEERFNSELEQFFSMITELNNEALGLSKVSTTEEVIILRNHLAKPYFSLVNSIKKFTPNGVEKDYLEGFNQGMRQITESLMAKGLQIDREKQQFLDKNQYFFEVQKNDIVALEKGQTLSEKLKKHTAILFFNTLDVANQTKAERVIAGQ